MIQSHNNIKSNPEFLRMKLYTIQELKDFGIGEKTLYSWVRDNIMIPFVKIGQVSKFRYEDFSNACKRVNNENREFVDVVYNDNKPSKLDNVKNKYLKMKIA